MKKSDLNLSLREITWDTLIQIMKLSNTLTDSQRQCVADNAKSIAQAYFAGSAWFRAVYLDDVPIGFVMVDTHNPDLPCEDHPSAFLWRYMIGRDWQNMGYGRHVMDMLVDYFRARGFCTMYTSTVMKEEESPYGFYIKYGFTDTGKEESGEQVLRYAFPDTKTGCAEILPVIPRISLITVWCSHVEKMKAFYRDVLGFMVKIDRGDYTEFENNGVRFALCRRGIMQNTSPDFFESVQGQRFELAFECEKPGDVDKSYKMLIEKGAVSVAPPSDMPWNQRTAFFKDPEGNIHEIFADIK